MLRNSTVDALFVRHFYEIVYADERALDRGSCYCALHGKSFLQKTGRILLCRSDFFLLITFTCW